MIDVIILINNINHVLEYLQLWNAYFMHIYYEFYIVMIPIHMLYSRVQEKDFFIWILSNWEKIILDNLFCKSAVISVLDQLKMLFFK